MDKYLVVLLGGGAGAVARYAAGVAVMTRYSGRFPLGTFLINVSGSFFIGLLMTLFSERMPGHANWRLFLVTGVLGGYTTFSSYAWETVQLVVRDGRVVSVMTRHTNLWTTRTPSRLEITYLATADALCRMVTGGEFPHAAAPMGLRPPAPRPRS